MMEWWQETRNNLRVQADVHIDDLPESPSPVRVVFTVTNTGSESADHPRLVFDDVKLLVDSPANHQEFECGILAAGDFMSVDYMCEYGDITELRYEAHAAISPEAFFGISTNSFNVGVDSISLPVKAYLQIYSECNIQDAGLDAIKKIPVPGSETTLRELDSLVNAVNEMQSKLREVKEKVERTAGVVIRTQRGRVLEHQKSVTAYIELCRRELQGVSKALQTNNANAVESAIAHAVQRLGGQMEQLREVTNTLQDS